MPLRSYLGHGCWPLRHGDADIVLADDPHTLLLPAVFAALIGLVLLPRLPARFLVSSVAAIAMVGAYKAAWAPQPDHWFASLPSEMLYVDGPPREWVPHPDVLPDVERDRKLTGRLPGQPVQDPYEPIVSRDGHTPVPGWFVARSGGRFLGTRHPRGEHALLANLEVVPGQQGLAAEARLTVHRDAAHDVTILAADGEPRFVWWATPSADYVVGARQGRLVWSELSDSIAPPLAWIAAAALGAVSGALCIALAERCTTEQGRRAALAWGSALAGSLGTPLAVAAGRGFVL